MKKVLITGGFGFIGTEIIDLYEGDYEITVLDNLLSGVQLEIPKRVNFILGDVRDKELLGRIVPGYDIVMHLAGIVGVPACSIDPNLAFDINVTATQYLVQAMSPGQRMIFISSASAYGTQHKPVNEDSALAPVSNYGMHKAMGELLVRNSPLDYIILRPATAFGTSYRVRLDLLPNTLTFIAATKKVIDLFQPEVIRPFVHVSDLARIFIHAINDRMPWNNIYNVGDPKLTMEKGHMAKIIADMCDATVILREGSDPDQRNYDVSFKKLLNTGFRFQDKPLETGTQQILSRLDVLRQDPDSFTTPYNVRRYIKDYA